MATLNQAWSIATGALAANQAALSVVSSNIANANTPGYTTENVQWGTADSLTLGTQGAEHGVSFEGASSQRDRVLNQRVDQQIQAQSATSARLSALNDLQSVFAGAVSATGSGASSSGSSADLGSQLSSFFQSLSSLASDPSSASLRAGVLTAAQSLASSFNQASANIGQQRSDLDATIPTAASQVNALTRDIAILNMQISAASQQGDAGKLEDQRQYDLQRLSQLIGMHSIRNNDNSLTVTTASGAVLVQGSRSTDMVTKSKDGVTHVTLAGVDQTASLAGSGGQMGGILQARDSDLPRALSSIDQLAYSVGTAVNAQQASGTDANGAPGTAIFSLGSGVSGSAGVITVLITDPSAIAASSAGAGSQDGSNATALAALASSAIAEGATPTSFYASLIGSIGAQVSDLTTTQATQSASLTQLQSQQNSLSSVDINKQAALLQSYEQSYQAAAKVFTILNSVMSSAINLGTQTAVSG